MIAKLKDRWSKRKYRTFLIFLLASFLAWLVTKLSEEHTDRTTFDLAFINAPDSLVLSSASKEEVEVRLQASGFQFLGFNFGPRQLQIDLSQAAYNGNRYYIAPEIYRDQVEKQLSEQMRVISMDREPLYLDFYRIYEKKVPVRSDLEMELDKNYLLDSTLFLRPDSILVRGPQNEIGKITELTTESRKLEAISEDFTISLTLNLPEKLEHTQFSHTEVTASGRVYRFSELVVQVPIKVINLPEGVAIKTFPQEVAVVCKGRIDRLKDLGPEDFSVVADYAKTGEGEDVLQLQLKNQPDSLHSVSLDETAVEFILKREE